MGRPIAILTLTDDEREKLQGWARRATSSQRLASRSRIILACEGDVTLRAVAKKLGADLGTVGKWRRRFIKSRVDGLTDDPRPGAPRKVSDKQVEDVVTRTLETKPRNATHWSTRDMAKVTGLSQTAIVRIWQAFGLKPHRTSTFKLSTDPYFTEKVRDVVGLYLNPPDRALVLCIDEKSQIQALDRTQPLLPMAPWQHERRTADYARHGTTSLFAALDVATGKVIGKCSRQHRQQEFLAFLKHVDATIDKQPGMTVHLVLDNYATHKTPSVKRWLLKHPEYHLHFTPTSGSWLNQVERFFAEITRRMIRRGVHRSTRSLEIAIMDYLDCHNENPKPFVWVADADIILERVARVCTLINDSGD
jgi:transposase